MNILKSNDKSKPTVGEEATKRLLNPDTKQPIIDTQREIDKNYFEDIEKCVVRYKKEPGYENEYFIVVLAKKERLMENVVRRYFFARRSLPTPDYDQTVWKYNAKTSQLEFIWTVPDHNTCQEMFIHPDRVPEDETWLYSFVRMFMTGTLYHSACKFLKMKPDIDVPKKEISLIL